MGEFSESIMKDAVLDTARTDVINECVKLIDKKEKKVEIEELQKITEKFFQKVIEESKIIYRRDNIAELIKEYNIAFWEDVKVGVLQKKLDGLDRGSLNDAEERRRQLEDFQIWVMKRDEKKDKSSKQNKNLAIRHQVSAKLPRKTEQGNEDEKYRAKIEKKREPVLKTIKMKKLFPYYAFIWNDEFTPNSIERDNLKYLKMVYVLALFLGENQNLRDKSMLQAFISQMKSSYKRTEKKQVEDEVEAEEIDVEAWKLKLKKELDTFYDDEIKYIKDFQIGYNEDSNRHIIKNMERLMETLFEMTDQLTNFFALQRKDVLISKEEIKKLESTQKRLRYFTGDKNDNSGKDPSVFKWFIATIGDSIKMVNKYSAKEWKGQAVTPSDLQYLKAAIEYAEEKEMLFNKPLLVKVVDDLTDWVLYEQYVSYAKIVHSETKKYGAGRLDYLQYSGLALREVANENEEFGETGIACNIENLNNNFWNYAEILRRELTDKYESVITIGGISERVGKECEHYTKVYKRLFEDGEIDLGTKGMLCEFFLELYKCRITNDIL